MEQHSYQNSASGSPSRRNRGSGDRGFWLAAVLCLFFFPPVGILMIVVKIGRASCRERVSSPV